MVSSFMTFLSVLFFHKRTVFLLLQVILTWTSMLSFLQIEKPYSQIRRIHFPFSIF